MNEVKIICQKCGSGINDHGYILKKYNSIPKHCQNCRQELPHRFNKNLVTRKELAIYHHVHIVDFPFVLERETADEFDIYCYGGRFFGSNWAGASYSEKFLFYIPKKLNRELAVRIRKMEKTFQKFNPETQKLSDPITSIYYCIENHNTEVNMKALYLHNFEEYFKTTLKGYGRDRDKNILIESEFIQICQVSTTAKTGRFGNTNTLILSPDKELKKEVIGIE
jgi:hypothetical protein